MNTVRKQGIGFLNYDCLFSLQLSSTDLHTFYLPQTILRMNRFKRQKRHWTRLSNAFGIAK
jgi:hypothetical protein